MTPGTALQVACVVAALFPAAVQANDSSALLEAGGIVLTTSADVTMESEELTIGRTRVSYVFRNTGTKEVRTRVAFPVPPIPVCGEADMGECEGDMQIGKGPNPMGFKLWVDGKAASFATEEKTTRGERNSSVRWRTTTAWGRSLGRSREVAAVRLGRARHSRDGRELEGSHQKVQAHHREGRSPGTRCRSVCLTRGEHRRRRSR